MNPEQIPAQAVPSSKLESWGYGILTALIFLAPIVVIPIPYLEQNAVKGYLLAFGVLVSAILYAISRWKIKSFEWIANPISYISVIFVVLLALSSAWSGDFLKYFFGQGFEYPTAAFMIILGIALLLTALYSSRSSSRALTIYTALFSSFLVVTLFQIIKLADPSALSFGLFIGAATTPLGTWYNLGIFSGIIFILLGIAFLYFPMSKAVKCAAGVLFAVPFFFLLIAGLPSVWLGIALVFLALIFHRLFNEKKDIPVSKRLPVFSGIVFIVAVFMVWQGNSVTNPLASALKVGYSETPLSWQTTLNIGTSIMNVSPILGSGPNTFAKEYLLYKPLAINLTQLWSTEFSNGSSIVLTTALSLGLSGIVLLCLLYVYFIRTGVKVLRKGPAVRADKSSDDQGNGIFLPFISFSSFFAGAFLLYIDLVYVPSYVNFFLTFVFIGIFFGSCIRSGDMRLVALPSKWEGKTRLYGRSFGAIILLVLIAGFVVYAMRATAFGYFTAGVADISASPLSSVGMSKAHNYFYKALALDHEDIYDQALAQTDLTAVRMIAQRYIPLARAQSRHRHKSSR